MFFNIDDKIFPYTLRQTPLSLNNTINENNKTQKLMTPVGLLRQYFVKSEEITVCLREYKSRIEPYFKKWVETSLPVSCENLKNTFEYVYLAPSSDDFYKSKLNEIINGFHKEIKEFSKPLPVKQSFYRGCIPNENFTNVGDEYDGYRPMSLTMLPDVAISHADRKCMKYPHRICKSIIYHLINQNPNIRGFPINHEGVDLNQVPQSMEHEFEVILAPPFQLKIMSKEEFPNHTILWIHIV